MDTFRPGAYYTKYIVKQRLTTAALEVIINLTPLMTVINEAAINALTRVNMKLGI